MKKLYHLIICSFLLIQSGKTFSQSFTFYVPDTIVYGVPLVDSSTDLYDSIVNNTANTLSIDVVRVENTTAAGWQTAFCLDVCYLPSVDSVRFTLQPNESQPFSFHFYTSATPDSGTALMKIKDVSNPATTVYQRFYAITQLTSVNELPAKNVNVSIYPSPVVAGNNFSMNIANVKSGSNEITLSVYNIYGSAVKRIAHLKTGNNSLTLDLPAGIYSYSLISGNEKINSGKIAVSR